MFFLFFLYFAIKIFSHKGHNLTSARVNHLPKLNRIRIDRCVKAAITSGIGFCKNCDVRVVNSFQVGHGADDVSDLCFAVW